MLHVFISREDAISMLEKLAKNVEKLSEGHAAMSQSFGLAMLMTRPSVYPRVHLSLPQDFPLVDEAKASQIICSYGCGIVQIGRGSRQGTAGSRQAGKEAGVAQFRRE